MRVKSLLKLPEKVKSLQKLPEKDKSQRKPPEKVKSLREKGSIGDVMPMGIFVICIAFVMISFADCVRVINVRSSVSQISREYILKMETDGFLTDADKGELLASLTDAGISDISLGSTDMSEVGYGNEIRLEIRGKTEDGYEISEFRTSTAKY